MRRFTDVVQLVAIATVAGCSSSGSSGGCTALGPMPGPYSGPKTDNAVNVQLSTEGVNYVNANWQQLVEMFAPGGLLQLPVPCSGTNLPVIGDVVLGDQG